MSDRTKLLTHFRRISCVISQAITQGPEGTLDGKFQAEHPTFVHYILAFYLAGCLAYAEGEDGPYSWNRPSQGYSDFDAFASANPPPPHKCFASCGITTSALNALACIRNAVVHNDGDLGRNRDSSCVDMVVAANIPGVALSGSNVTLEAEFLEFVRVASLAVRMYYGEF